MKNDLININELSCPKKTIHEKTMAGAITVMEKKRVTASLVEDQLELTPLEMIVGVVACFKRNGIHPCRV